MIPDEAVEAAVPWINNFMERRGFALRGKEAEALAAYVIQAAAPHLMAAAVDRARSNNDHIVPGSGAYSSGFHYALDCVWPEDTHGDD